MVPERRTPELVLRAQDHPFDHPDSRFMFRKPLVATPAALEAFGPELIQRCYLELQQLAEQRHGLDYTQAFDGPPRRDCQDPPRTADGPPMNPTDTIEDRRDKTADWFLNGLGQVLRRNNPSDTEGPPLWFIEDDLVVTALLPSDY